MLLGGCRMFEKEPTGEPIYVLDLWMEGDTLCWAEKTEDGVAAFRDTALREPITVPAASPDGMLVMGRAGAAVYGWVSARRALCVYENGAFSDLYRMEPDSSRVILGGVLRDGVLWYAQAGGSGNTGLWRLGPDDPTPKRVSDRAVVALTLGGDYLICAVEQGEDLVFYAGPETETPMELARWEQSGYYLNGSCLLTAGDNKAACALTTDREKQFFEFFVR